LASETLHWTELWIQKFQSLHNKHKVVQQRFTTSKPHTKLILLCETIQENWTYLMNVRLSPNELISMLVKEL